VTYADKMACRLLHDVTAEGPFDALKAARAVVVQILEDAAKEARGPHVKQCQCGAMSCVTMRNSAWLVERLTTREEGPERG
jgi:hypothetical protein